MEGISRSDWCAGIDLEDPVKCRIPFLYLLERPSELSPTRSAILYPILLVLLTVEVTAGIDRPSNGPIWAPSRDTSKSITIAMVGDLMLGSNFPSAANLPPNDARDLLKEAITDLSSADLTFGNLEGVLLTVPGPVKKCRDSTVCYAFKSPDHYVNRFLEAGIDVMSTANNHVGDFGEPGRANTKRVLSSAGMAFAGLLDKPYEIFRRGSTTYGFCAFAPNNGTMPINDLDRMARLVRHLDSLADIVIVSFHGGAEGTAYGNITRKTEMFLGENRGNPYAFARRAIDAGADVVIGHGPHVPRAIDVYKSRFIAYSLGNFATYGFNTKGPLGMAPIITVKVNPKGEFVDGRILSYRQEKYSGPKPDSSAGALNEIKRLTETDVPESGLAFESDGRFYRRKK